MVLGDEVVEIQLEEAEVIIIGGIAELATVAEVLHVVVAVLRLDVLQRQVLESMELEPYFEFPADELEGLLAALADTGLPVCIDPVKCLDPGHLIGRSVGGGLGAEVIAVDEELIDGSDESLCLCGALGFGTEGCGDPLAPPDELLLLAIPALKINVPPLG